MKIMKHMTRVEIHGRNPKGQDHSPATGSRNPSIQLLRVSACLMVFLVHFGQRVELLGALKQFTDFGARGVQLFFLISGYLAAASFVGKQQADIKQYYIKRGISILPLYYLVICYYFITESFLNHFRSVIPEDELGIGWLRYLFLLNGIFNSETYFWSNLGITWTIPIFACFYLIAPWILRRIRGIGSALVAWGSVYLLCKGIGSVYPCSLTSNLHVLFWGVVIYCCGSMGCSAQAAAVLSATALMAVVFKNTMAVYICLFSCLLLAMLQIPGFSFPAKMRKVVDVLDRYSYTIYLMHGVVFCSLVDRLVYMEVPKGYVAVTAIAGTVFAVWIVGKYMEKPIQSALRKRLLR